ncbi:glycosyltransferase [bacterium]|nr:glycosyltransferase [bacterium]
MRILIIDTYYESFLESFHREFFREGMTYDELYRVLMAQLFGTADFYSQNLKRLGHQAKEVVVNYLPLQKLWIMENLGRDPVTSRIDGLVNLLKGIPRARRLYRLRQKNMAHAYLLNQIRDYCPDIIYIQNMDYFSNSFLSRLKSSGYLIAGQIAHRLSPRIDLKLYNLILTSFPHYIELFRGRGVQSEYLKLAFEPAILKVLSPVPSRNLDCTFVGSFSPEHNSSLPLFEKLASKIRFFIWGYGIDTIPPGSPVHKCYQGQAAGLGMYRIYGRSKIVVNRHIAAAGKYANNIRLFESTGMGAMLLTDEKGNMADLFIPGKECVTYSNPDDCVEKVQYYLAHDEQREAIAQAGKKRTLEEHNYFNRMKELIKILDRLL